MISGSSAAAVILLTLVLLVDCAPGPTADLVLRNAAVYTGVFMTVADGKVVYEP